MNHASANTPACLAIGDVHANRAASVVKRFLATTGDPESSYFLESLIPSDGTAEMPKDKSPLEKKEIATIRSWIESGANWPADLLLKPPVLWSTDTDNTRPARVLGNCARSQKCPIPTVDRCSAG